MTARKNPVLRQPDAAVLAALMVLVEAAGGTTKRRPLVLGLCGAQGSGKSTLAAGLVDAARARGLAATALSLDDLYLTRAKRAVLAREVHPLLATRGVPGTHAVALGRDLLARLDAGQAIRLPRFDKASDDRAPQAGWEDAGPLDLLVFEGWCVGAVAQEDAALADPVNALEAEEDRDARWRSWVNARLASDYRDLFARIDALVLLAAPGFDVVAQWRLEQEQGGAAVMDAEQIARFVQHYERLTRHILAEMPGRADLVVRLDRHRNPLTIVSRSS